MAGVTIECDSIAFFYAYFVVTKSQLFFFSKLTSFLLQVLQHLNVFDEDDLDTAAEALDDVIFFL